jgi:hypothetical protein
MRDTEETLRAKERWLEDEQAMERLLLGALWACGAAGLALVGWIAWEWR